MPLSKALNLQGASRWATSLITACPLPPCEGEGRKSLPVRLRLRFDHRTRRLLFKEAFIFVVFNQFGLNFPSEEIKKNNDAMDIYHSFRAGGKARLDIAYTFKLDVSIH